MLPPNLERIREKLAENIHELWVMNKIELGWTYGAVSISQIIDVTDLTLQGTVCDIKFEDIHICSKI